jgi:hypothetical protein
MFFYGGLRKSMTKYAIGIDPGPTIGFAFGEIVDNAFKVSHRDTQIIGNEADSKGDINNYWANRSKIWFETKKKYFDKADIVIIEKQFHFGHRVLPSFIIYTCLLPLCHYINANVKTISPKSVCAHFKLKKKLDSYDTKKKNSVNAIFTKAEQENDESGRLHDQADAILCVRYYIEKNKQIS